MTRRVLIALDGSELAEQVVPHLLRFIAPDRTELLMMTALSSSVFPLFRNAIRSLTSEQIAMFNKGKAYEQVQALTQQLNETGFRVKSEVLSGAPAESILRLAEETNVDLIAMSTHGRTGLGLALLGSVADEVVCNARAPIFLVPPKAVVKPGALPRTIFLPLDGTLIAETAIPAACQLAQSTNAVIHLVRVVEPHDLEGGPKNKSASLTSIDSDYAREQPIIRQAVCYLKRIQLRLQLAGIASRYQISVGAPAETITCTARTENADLIVMSTRGRTGVERKVYGSVVSQVISNAIWPMLIMRGKVTVSACERDVNVVPETSCSC